MRTAKHRTGAPRPPSAIFVVGLLAALALSQASVVALADPPGDPAVDPATTPVEEAPAQTANVTVSKSNDPIGAVEPGGSITYTLTVSNEGDTGATGVVVVDELPTGVTYGSATSGCAHQGGVVTCALGDVGVGASATAEITVSVDQETCGEFRNLARVSTTNEAGPEEADNTSNEVTNTVACAEPAAGPDLRVTKTSDADGLLREGDVVTYTVVVTNAGDEQATGVELHDDLPPGVHVMLSPFPSLKGQLCTVVSTLPPGGVPVASVHCGPISLDAAESATMVVRVTNAGDRCRPLTNVARVEGANEPAENVGPDNRDQVSDEVVCPASIRLIKDGPSLAHVGDRVTYTFAVRNDGRAKLSGIEVKDPMCDRRPARVEGARGDAVLGAGELWRFRCDHVITAADGDPVENRAVVEASHDGGKVSDRGRHTLNVIHPDISIVASASPTSGTPGTGIVYTYLVTNVGDASLSNVVVRDDVLGGIGTVGTLAPGVSARLTHGSTLGPAAVTTTATASGTDALGLVVTSTDTVTVTAVAGASGGDGGNGDGTGGGGGGSPFTGSDVGGLVAAVALLGTLGTVLVAATRRRSGPAS